MKPVQQFGFSIIELMIAITLGMVLMGAALQFIVGTRATYDINEDISRVQENGRMALDMIVRDLQMAGYRPPNKGDGEIPNFFQMDTTIADTFLMDGGGTNSDRLAIQFDPPPDDGTERGCTGATIPANSIIVSVYEVRTVDGISTLFCGTYDKTVGSWIAGGNPTPLIDGIDNMQILYRVEDTTVNPTTFRFIRGDQLTTADYPNISAARVGLLVGSGLTDGAGEAKSRTYRVLDSDPIVTLATDTQIRRIYSTTVQFNNKSI